MKKSIVLILVGSFPISLIFFVFHDLLELSPKTSISISVYNHKILLEK